MLNLPVFIFIIFVEDARYQTYKDYKPTINHWYVIETSLYTVYLDIFYMRYVFHCILQVFAYFTPRTI